VAVAPALAKAQMAGVVVMMQAVQQGGAFIVWWSVVCKTSRSRGEWAYIVPACAESEDRVLTRWRMQNGLVAS
jgi:hypothetical protein